MNRAATPRAENQPGRVLVIATDPRLIEDVHLGLAAAHVSIQTTESGTPLVQALSAGTPDLGIVDADVAPGDVLREVRSLEPVLALIALTRVADLPARLRAFQDGADDVLRVPFAAEELLARYTALRRRAGLRSTQSGVLRAEGLEINVLRRRASLGGVDLRLTPVEQSLLYLLASNPGRLLSRDQILDAVWGQQFAADSNLVDRHIRNLRAKLHDNWRQPRFIVTVNGGGYVFTVQTSPEPILQKGEQSLVQL